VHLQPDGARRAQLHRDWKARHIAAQRGLCHYCATPFDDAEHQATIDHVEPIARGGGDVFENTVAACRRCNTAKRDLDPREFLAALQMHRRGIVTPVSHAIGHSGAGTGSAGTAFSPSGT
jgi:5-methylcytosine-specific restriction endonuclease McrA